MPFTTVGYEKLKASYERTQSKNAADNNTNAVSRKLGDVSDSKVENNVIHHNVGELSIYGLFIFFYFQSFVLAKRLSEAYKKSEDYSNHLKKMSYLLE